MRKRSAYRPKGANPQAWIVAMQGASLLSKDDQARRAARMQMAVDAIRKGEGMTEDWREVFDVLNMVEAFSKMPSVMTGAAEFIEREQELIVGVLDRQRATGLKALRSHEIAALLDLSAVWADVLGAVTHAEYFKAESFVRARVVAVLRGPVPGVHLVGTI